MDSNTFQFDINTYEVKNLEFKPNSRFVIISKSGSGKSILCLNILYNLITKNPTLYKSIYVLSETAYDNDDNDYAFINSKFRKRYNDENLSKIFNHYKLLKANNNSQNCILILDDIRITRSQALEDIFVRGRHYNITVILSVQFASHGLSPIIRNNFNYLFIKEMNNITLYKICKEVIIIPGINETDIFNYIINNNDGWKFIMYNNWANINKKDRMKVIESAMLNLQVISKTNKKKK